LFAALATCVGDDLYREAAKCGIEVSGSRSRGDWHPWAGYTVATLAMKELAHQFRGDVLRSLQASGVALVDQHTKIGSNLPRHQHEHGWFTFLFAGSYIERLLHSDRRCSAGMVLWHPPGLVHENCFISSGHNLNIAFEPRWLANLSPDITLPQTTCCWEGGLPYRFGMRLYRSLNMDAKVPMESVFDLIALCASSVRMHEPPIWLRHVLSWMNDEYSGALTLTQAAKHANVHPVHVSRSFRRQLGCTFREHLTLIRIRRATDLLKRSSASVTEIAFSCGFSDHPHFARTFKGITGLTPTAYRAQAG
jgi:AraC family transcriptional regulator